MRMKIRKILYAHPIEKSVRQNRCSRILNLNLIKSISSNTQHDQSTHVGNTKPWNQKRRVNDANKTPEVRIYKRKQENKKKKHALD